MTSVSIRHSNLSCRKTAAKAQHVSLDASAILSNNRCSGETQEARAGLPFNPLLPGGSMFKHILLPTDGSALSDKGVRQTIKMAKALGAQITAVHVVHPYRPLTEEGYVMPEVAVLREQFDKDVERHSNDVLNPVREAAVTAGVKCATVVAASESPYEAIISQAKKSRCDLIMMASHGRKGIQRLLHGSETAKVLTHSKIPVLVLR
jgi:nucleotide-binding universal stress UspA family protein